MPGIARSTARKVGTVGGAMSSPMQPKVTGSAGGAVSKPMSSSKPAPAKARASSTTPKASPSSSGGGSSSNRQSYSGGGSSGGGSSYSGGGGGGYSGGGSADMSFATLAPEPIMETIVIPDAEADSGYQKTVADLARAAVDFKAQQGLARSQYDGQYNEAGRRMGWDGTLNKFDRNRPGAYRESVEANENDFAGRGTFWSGANAEAFGDINRDFADRKSSLDMARTNDIDTQNLALSSFTGNQDAVRQAALTDVVAKLAAQFAIDPSAVPRGQSSTVTREKVG